VEDGVAVIESESPLDEGLKRRRGTETKQNETKVSDALKDRKTAIQAEDDKLTSWNLYPML